MKKLSLLAIIAIIAVLALTSCDGGSGSGTGSTAAAATTATASAGPGYVFTANGVSVTLGAEAAPIIKALGTYTHYLESPFCAGQGIGKTYSYPGFEVSTYQKNDTDGTHYIPLIVLKDDSIATPEGVSIGGTLQSMINAYGSGYSEDGGQYTYDKGQTSLIFQIQDDAITVINYQFNK